MRNCKYLFLSVLLIFISCSKEDEINELNETIVALQSEIAKLNSDINDYACLLYTSPSPRDATLSRMPSSA